MTHKSSPFLEISWMILNIMNDNLFNLQVFEKKQKFM